MKNYYAPPRSASERFSHEYSRAVLRDILHEDLHMMEQTQAGVTSAAGGPRRERTQNGHNSTFMVSVSN